AALPLCAVECLRKVTAEIVHAAPHVVDCLHEPVVPRGRLAPAPDDLERSDAEPQKSRRGDDRADGSARDVGSPTFPARTVVRDPRFGHTRAIPELRLVSHPPESPVLAGRRPPVEGRRGTTISATIADPGRQDRTSAGPSCA